MRRTILTTLFASIWFCSTAFGQTVLPLNTGYNHASFTVYPVPGPSTPDNYWIKIASYEPPAASVPVAPAWVLNPAGAPWAPALPGSRWIGPRTTHLSSPGTNQTFPAYSIFRKCFCLMPGYQQAQLNFALRADDNVAVYLNSVLNTLLSPVIGNWGSGLGSGPPQTGGTTNPQHFKVGINCIYVYVEDVGSHMGFTLQGNVSAFGLLPVAGAWAGPKAPPSFAPCQCNPGSTKATGVDSRAMAVNSGDDSAVIREIIKIAEARRTQRRKGTAR